MFTPLALGSGWCKGVCLYMGIVCLLSQHLGQGGANESLYIGIIRLLSQHLSQDGGKESLDIQEKYVYYPSIWAREVQTGLFIYRNNTFTILEFCEGGSKESFYIQEQYIYYPSICVREVQWSVFVYRNDTFPILALWSGWCKLVSLYLEIMRLLFQHLGKGGAKESLYIQE